MQYENCRRRGKGREEKGGEKREEKGERKVEVGGEISLFHISKLV